MTRYASFVESRIQANGGTFVAGKSPLYADLILSMTVKGIQSGFYDHIRTDFYNRFPGIMATVQAVDQHEKVKSYYESLRKD